MPVRRTMTTSYPANPLHWLSGREERKRREGVREDCLQDMVLSMDAQYILRQER